MYILKKKKWLFINNFWTNARIQKKETQTHIIKRGGGRNLKKKKYC